MDWHRHAAEAGFFYVPKLLMVSVLDDLPEKEVVRIVRDLAKHAAEDIALIMRGDLSVSTFFDLLENWVRTSSFPYTHQVIDGTDCFVIQHDLGRVHSVFLKEFFDYILRDLVSKEPEFRTTDNTVMIKVDLEGKAAK